MLEFRQFGDGKWRAFDEENEIQYTSSVDPAEVNEWEDSGFTNKQGWKVLTPKAKTRSIETKKVVVHKTTETITSSVEEYEFL